MFKPFREHGLWQCRGHRPDGLHFNRAFRRKTAAELFLKLMAKNCMNTPRY